MRPTNRGANGNGGSAWIRKERRLAIYMRDGFACLYCGRDLRDAPKEEVTLDHLDTRAGMDARRALGLPLHPATRLVTACRRCNSSRRDRTWYDYASGGAVERIRRTVRRQLNIDLAKAILAGEVHPLEEP